MKIRVTRYEFEANTPIELECLVHIIAELEADSYSVELEIEPPDHEQN